MSAAVVASLLVVSVVAGAGTALATDPRQLQQTQGPTEVGECTTITEPGRYVLTQDIQNSPADVCIDIRTSDVVFDGQGYTLDGNLTRGEIEQRAEGAPPLARIGVGVNVRGPGTTDVTENVTVENVGVTNWYHGVLSENVTDSAVTAVVASDNGGGIIYDNSSRVTVADSTSTNNVILGVVLDSTRGEQTDESVVVNNTLTDNGIHGLAIIATNDSGVADNTMSNNGLFGIFAFATSRTTFENNTANGNGFAGLLFYDTTEPTDAPLGPVTPQNPRVPDVPTSTQNVVRNNDFSESGYAGIILEQTTDNLVVNNDVSNATGNAPFPVAQPASGIVVDDANGNEIRDTTATGIQGAGITVFNGSVDNVLVDNELSGNAESGVVVENSTNTAVLGNAVRDNGGDGVRVEDARNSIVARNTVVDNDGSGIVVVDSVRSIVVANEIRTTGGQAVRVVDSTQTIVANAPLPAGVPLSL